MITATGITRALGVLGVVGFMAHATASLATSGAYQEPVTSSASALPEPAAATPPGIDAAPLPLEPEPVKELPPAPDEPGLDLALPPAAAATPPAAKPESAPTPKAEIPPSAAPAPIQADEPNPLPPARELTSRPAKLPDPAPDAEEERPAHPARRTPPAQVDPANDPDAHARSFVERNRREADEQLKALREEAAQLKGRLARVEAGIRRWESLAEALERSQDRPATAAADPSARARARAGVQYVVPGGSGVIIQSQPVTRSDYVPAPQPR